MQAIRTPRRLTFLRSGARVLVACADRVTAASLVRGLRFDGCEVSAASDAADLLATLLAAQANALPAPDVLVLDSRLAPPALVGALSALRRQGRAVAVVSLRRPGEPLVEPLRSASAACLRTDADLDDVRTAVMHVSRDRATAPAA